MDVTNHYKMIDTFFEGEHEYIIFDIVNPKTMHTERRLSAKTSIKGCNYTFSAIHKDNMIKEQPIYILVQKLIAIWDSFFSLKDVLVLGCAGCTIPRFLNNTFPLCNILGVEYSGKMIEVAQNYFYINSYPNFNIIQNDAFEFVINKKGDFDLIYVDIFNGSNIDKRVLSFDFLNNLQNQCRDNAIIIINLLNQNHTDIINSESPYIRDMLCFVVEQNERTFLVLIRCSNNKYESIKNKISKIPNISLSEFIAFG